MNPVNQRSAQEIAAEILTRRISALETVEAHLDWIQRVNPLLHAIVQLDADRAIDRAREIDELLDSGIDVGPLAGVPFTAKDNLETQGIVTAAGVIERKDYVPDRDATVVRRLKDAGGILLGKSNCPPWGGGLETDNEIYGRSSNPYDADRTPGGSSGGEAAAIAAGMSACGLGSDSGGSVRFPAHCCGLASIKPTSGLVPSTGMIDDLGQVGALRDPRTQIGPMARGVSDVTLLLRIIAGPDGLDASTVPVPLGDPNVESVDGVKVAVQLDNGEVAPTSATVETVHAAAGVLEEAGAEIRNAELPDEGFELTRTIWRSYRGDTSTSEFYRILHDWDFYRTRLLDWFEDFDLIIRPISATPAPLHGETSDAELYTLPFSLAGWPCATVRCDTSPEGLPIGVQVVAHPWRDSLALFAAERLEESLIGWIRPVIS